MKIKTLLALIMLACLLAGCGDKKKSDPAGASTVQSTQEQSDVKSDASTATSKPKMTVEPAVTSKPEATTEPTVTSEPEATTKPAVTSKPKTTTAPTASSEPETTSEPTVTSEPETTTTTPGPIIPDETNEDEVVFPIIPIG